MPFQQSPMIDAANLVRTDAEGLPLADLKLLADQVIQVLFALHELRNTQGIRAAPETQAIIFRISQLELYNARLADLIQVAYAKAVSQALSIKAARQSKTKSAPPTSSNTRS